MKAIALMRLLTRDLTPKGVAHGDDGSSGGVLDLRMSVDIGFVVDDPARLPLLPKRVRR